jgi:radical SAM superfamily enzyme YgiQ (UPF0313 family)
MANASSTNDARSWIRWMQFLIRNGVWTATRISLRPADAPLSAPFAAVPPFWDKPRFFSAAYVVDEIEEILRTFPGSTRIVIWDDLFVAQKPRFAAIMDLLEQKSLIGKLQFLFACRANFINDELCRDLKRLRVPSTSFGAESGSNRILKLMNKASTVEKNQQALDCLHRNGIPAACSFIVGWPTETEEEVLQTFEFILKNVREGKLIDYPVNILMPIPGTPVWDQAVQAGVINPQTMDWQRLAIFASYSNSAAGSLAQWIEHRRANRSLYLAEETLPQERLYEIMLEYQEKFRLCRK